jgi:hypothetical protein
LIDMGALFSEIVMDFFSWLIFTTSVLYVIKKSLGWPWFIANWPKQVSKHNPALIYASLHVTIKDLKT